MNKKSSQSVFKYISGKPLWVHVLIGLFIVFLVLFLFLNYLDVLTKHGEILTVPSVNGKNFEDARKLLEERGFDVELQDSVYVDTARANSVVRQFPDADAVVKVNRTVYLTINRSVPPVIEMPNFMSMTFRSAEVALKQYGLQLEDTMYRHDFAKNAVLDQLYNGVSIKPGSKISMGSKITLVLGSGLGQDEFAVPDLIGLTYEQAKALLEGTGLSIGAVMFDSDVRDSLNAFVYQQRPEKMTPDNRVIRIRQGQAIDLFLGLRRPERPLDSSGAQY
jgi:beta-lactam-binding protein with PASTA domain